MSGSRHFSRTSAVLLRSTLGQFLFFCGYHVIGTYSAIRQVPQDIEYASRWFLPSLSANRPPLLSLPSFLGFTQERCQRGIFPETVAATWPMGWPSQISLREAGGRAQLTWRTSTLCHVAVHSATTIDYPSTSSPCPRLAQYTWS